jgi:xylulokinase
MHEQIVNDWWNGLIKTTGELLQKTVTSPSEIKCVSLSGHSLVTVPIDKDLNVLMDRVPIWSDSRASAECGHFFKSVDAREWYMTTGNGFPAPLYSIFKIMWLKKHRPDIY